MTTAAAASSAVAKRPRVVALRAMCPTLGGQGWVDGVARVLVQQTCARRTGCLDLGRQDSHYDAAASNY